MCDDVDEPSSSISDAVILDDNMFASAPNDPFEIDSAWIEEDSLHIIVQYGGGCGGTVWQLVSEETAIEPRLPRINVRLSLEDNDNCEALLVEKKSFSLEPLKVFRYDELAVDLVGWDIEMILEGESILSNISDDDKSPIPAGSSEPIILSNDLFENAPDDYFTIDTVWFEAGQLNIITRYGGGCGETAWKLIASEEVAESYPVQMSMRLSLRDDDSCEALLIATLGYDLSPLHAIGGDKISLNLQGWDKPILYEY